MGWPSRKEINQVLKELKKIEPSYGLPENATLADQFKYKLCLEFIAYFNKHKMTRVEFAELLEIDPARVSEILKRKIWLFTADRLINLLEKINPKLKLTVA